MWSLSSIYTLLNQYKYVQLKFANITYSLAKPKKQNLGDRFVNLFKRQPSFGSKNDPSSAMDYIPILRSKGFL